MNNKNLKIPKIIHQSFVSNQLPLSLSENISKLKNINPDWEYRFYDDDEMVKFISKYYKPYIVNCFNKINPKYGAARADLFRYLLIYKVGGVWLDIKSSTNEPLNNVLQSDDTFILSQWQNKISEPFQNWGLHPALAHIPGGEFQQWNIISTPENPFIKAVIEKVLRNIHNYNYKINGVGRMGVLRTTGPIAYSLAIEPLLKKYKHRFVDSDRDLKLQYSIFDNQTTKYLHEELYETHYTKLIEPVILH